MCNECERLRGKIVDVICDNCAREHGGKLNTDHAWYYFEPCNICKKTVSVTKAYRWIDLPWMTTKKERHKEWT